MLCMTILAPNYFSTMGISLIAGREFSESDTATSPKGLHHQRKAGAAILRGAQSHWPAHDPRVGQTFIKTRRWKSVGRGCQQQMGMTREAISSRFFTYLIHRTQISGQDGVLHSHRTRSSAMARHRWRSLISAARSRTCPVKQYCARLEEQVSNSMLKRQGWSPGLSISLAFLAAACSRRWGLLWRARLLWFAQTHARNRHSYGTRRRSGAGTSWRLFVGQGMRLAVGGRARDRESFAALVAMRWVAEVCSIV